MYLMESSLELCILSVSCLKLLLKILLRERERSELGGEESLTCTEKDYSPVCAPLATAIPLLSSLSHHAGPIHNSNTIHETITEPSQDCITRSTDWH